MTTQYWFSSKLRTVCLVERHGATRYMDSVFLFRATDFETAFRRALDIGRSQEQGYTNADGERVVWKFVKVVSLDQLPKEDLDGAEVYSEPVSLGAGEMMPFESHFEPEQSRPTQSI
jgi:hypothetical protein